jgi:hypothetical protein
MVHFAERGDVFTPSSVGGPNRGWLKYHKDGTVSEENNHLKEDGTVSEENNHLKEDGTVGKLTILRRTGRWGN